MDQDRETLGQYLKRKREARHLSVQEMALSAGVKTSFIEAIEEDKFDVFTQYSQIVWLVKKYAKYLNLNQAEVLQRFEMQWDLCGGNAKSFPQLSLFPDSEPSFREPAGRKTRMTFGRLPKAGVRLAVIVTIIMIAFSLLTYWLDSKQETTPLSDSRFTETAKTAAVPPDGRIPPSPADAVKAEEPQKRVPDVIEKSPRPVISRNDVLEGKNTTHTQKKALPPQKGMEVVGNRDTKRYHMPGMKYYNKVKEYHRVTFPSEKDAIKSGYHKAME